LGVPEPEARLMSQMMQMVSPVVTVLPVLLPPETQIGVYHTRHQEMVAEVVRLQEVCQERVSYLELSTEGQVE
jgi:hypothetical protein